MLNGIAERNIHIQEATLNNDINFEIKVDLILSLMSWGFHYPVSTYLQSVYNTFRDGGIVILDIRKGTEGRNIIDKQFGNSMIIQNFSKYERVLAIKSQKKL